MLDFQPEPLTFLARIFLAAVLGGLVGLERDIHGRAAGLRTHLLVSLGAAVFTVLSQWVAAGGAQGATVPDPGRIAAQIVTGIGFLGAGVILKEGVSVRGLTTAACLWTAAAIGMSAGAGYWKLAVATTLVALLSLVGLKAFEGLYKKDSYRSLTVVTQGAHSGAVVDLVGRENLKIVSCEIERDSQTDQTVTKLGLSLFHKGITDKLAHGLIQELETADFKVLKVKWRRSH